jgi:hypothetical protein
MFAEGKSQRSIAGCIGCDRTVVSKVLDGGKTQTAQNHQSEEPKLEGEQKTQTAQTDETIQSEEPTSVFTHATSVTPVENPWEDTETPS